MAPHNFPTATAVEWITVKVAANSVATRLSCCTLSHVVLATTSDTQWMRKEKTHCRPTGTTITGTVLEVGAGSVATGLACRAL
jgi:hypothetical protein